MTVIDLGKGPGSGVSGPTIVQAAAAMPSPVTAKTTVLSVSASDPSGTSGLTYTWTTTGTPPAPVSFSANGTNAARAVTATFSKAGSYNFQVVVTDPSGFQTKSSVTVVVNQTLSAIKVTPASVTVPAGGQQMFSAAAYEQFGTLMSSQPGFTWSMVSGGGSIAASRGLYTAPSVAGSATVKASSGSITSTASITIAPPATSGFKATAAFAVVSDWRTGFQGSLTITNTGTTAINAWSLQFNFASTITSIWNATLANHTGTTYVIQNAGYNSTIAPGQNVNVGFLGALVENPLLRRITSSTAFPSAPTRPRLQRAISRRKSRSPT